MQEINVEYYRVFIRGLHMRYKAKVNTTTIYYDSFAMCALLLEAGIIEGFDSDGHEPVILYKDNNNQPYGWCHWSQFIKTFPFDAVDMQRIAFTHYRKNNPVELAVKKVKQEKLIAKEVLPPIHLYNLHNYYNKHVRANRNSE